MPKPQLDSLNLGSIARGAALELFEKAISDAEVAVLIFSSLPNPTKYPPLSL
jgi:hypothetical protein